MDEAIAISKVCSYLINCSNGYHPSNALPNYVVAFQVMQFVDSLEYSMFTRIVFDTAPTVSRKE